MNFFEKNMGALVRIDPVLGANIYAIAENKRFEVFQDEEDAININIYDKEKDFFFYHKKPIDEVSMQYDTLMQKYSRYPYLWLFGFSNGLLIKMLLNLEKTLFIFEPNIELIYIALHFLDFSTEISSKRVRIFYTANVTYNTINAICSSSEIKAFLKIYSLEVTHPYYLQYHFEEMDTINKLFVENIKDIITQEGNDANDSLIGLDHHLQHLPKMIASYPIQNLKNKINTQHAIIVSTGPSLHKQLKFLKEYQDYITILCIDASLPILQKEGIRPDFVFTMERVEATAKFFENLDRELLKDTIFIPTSISHPKTIKNIGDLQTAISMRPFGYTNAFKLNKWGYIGLGMSSANMAFDFAYIANFKNIVFIGQDLAFAEDGTTHTKGAIYGEKEQQYEKHLMYIKGYYGDVVKTSKWWVLFLSTFKRDIPKVKEDGMSVYNCTEGGAYIEGAEHIPFLEFLQKIEKIKKVAVQCSAIDEKKQYHLIKRSKRLIELYIKDLQNVQKEVEKVFLLVMENIENLEKLNNDNNLEKIDFDELLEVIDKIDTIKDLYESDRVLKNFTNITSPFIVNAELELAVLMVHPSNSEIEKKKKMIEWIYAHKSWLFFLAGAIENMIFLLDKNYKEIYQEI